MNGLIASFVILINWWIVDNEQLKTSKLIS